jgi:hypothetical protein
MQVIVSLGQAPETPMRALLQEEVGLAWFANGLTRRVVSRSPQRGCLWDCYFDTPANQATVFVPRSMIQLEEGREVVPCPVVYPLDQLLLTYHMAPRQGVILHAAGAFREGRGALFLGRSRAGKSTISRQLEAHGGFRMLSDDRVIVRRLGEGHTAFGTPWPGEAKIARNESVPLNGLFFLHQATENRIEQLTPRLAFERLLPVASIPWFDPDVFPSVLEYLETLTHEVPAYELHFKPTPEIAAEIDRYLGAMTRS